MSKQPPPTPTTSAVGPCPTVIQIGGRPGTGSLPSTIAPPDHPLIGSPLNHQDPFIQRHGSQLTANELPPFRLPFTSRRGIRLAYSFPGPARGAIKEVSKAINLDWINNQACRLSQNIYVITNLFITNNYLFEMIRTIIFTNYFSEFIHQVPIKFRF